MTSIRTRKGFPKITAALIAVVVASAAVGAGMVWVYTLQASTPTPTPSTPIPPRFLTVSAVEAKQLIDSNPDVTVLDVRTADEFNGDHIDGAVNIPVQELQGRLRELDENNDILVYCRTGVRSLQASQVLVDNGFTRVYNMEGGIEAWIAGGFPTATSNIRPHPDETSGWSLRVDGFVQHPLNLTFSELVAMPRTNAYAELYCVGNPNTPVDKGEWIGVKLGLLLDKVGVFPEALKAAFYAEDGFTTDLTVEEAVREDIILAYEKDGEPLPGSSSGHPSLRLVVPGKWGYKWIRDIVHIELVNYDFKGSWESLGYSDSAEVSDRRPSLISFFLEEIQTPTLGPDKFLCGEVATYPA